MQIKSAARDLSWQNSEDLRKCLGREFHMNKAGHVLTNHDVYMNIFQVLSDFKKTRTVAMK